MLDAAVDHVAVAVRSIKDAMRVYRDALGSEFLAAGDVPAQGFRWAQFRLPGGGKIELVAPVGDGFLSRFLETRGEGVHHVTLRVSDIHAALRHLENEGVPVFGVSTEHDDWKEAFIHPRDAHGALIQLAQPRLTDEEMARRHLRGAGEDGQPHVSLAQIEADEPLDADMA